MTQETQSKPALPDHYGIIGLAIGFALSYVYYQLVIGIIPNEMWPIHLLPLVGIVPIFLGVPVVFEKVYWRLSEEIDNAE